jgi:cystathionine beta-lyase
LCNPHNPGGRVWIKEELVEMARICHEHGVMVVSDEIHADITLPPHKHLPFATVSKEAAEISLTFMAPSKAFNMPALASSYAIAVDETIRTRFQTFMEAGEFAWAHPFATVGTIAAYQKGDEWLDELLTYIKGNIDFLDDYLQKHIPQLSFIRPQASYLVFLDCRALGLSQEALVSLFIDKAHLALNDGSMFGVEGEGFMRLNVGCPRAVLAQALKQLADALK